ncbi:hypothetical protein [Massilia timonae]|uniref:hypothetical protein n=1 Tax=Massilia timonae TaxID=47229 RepID=UPI00160D6731|nr:hypothetical protein [Massilia timonae]
MIFCFSLNVSAASNDEKNLLVERRYEYRPVPSDCVEEQKKARDFLLSVKEVNLQPIASELVPDKESDKTESDGVIKSYYLAPVGFHAAALMERDMQGNFRSIFVDCQTGEKYISLRGGVADQTRWFGPIK